MPHRAVTIIMIEDDAGHARLIEKNVRRAGVCNEIVAFDTGASALAYLEDPAQRGPGPFLVLLDLNLPDISGVDVLARIKSDDMLRRAPVVVLTTTDDRHEVQRCYDLGANVYVTKPVDYDAFTQAIRQLGLFLSVMQIPDVT